MKANTQVIFFWDYDAQWGADRSRGPGGNNHRWGHLEFINTERLLELHDTFQIPACFAVVGSAALDGNRPYHDPDQIRRIHAAGNEVASHTHRHEWIPGLPKNRLKETLRTSKDALEQCIGAEVVSFVPPYNQPFDYLPAGSISLAERREARSDRTDLRRLCETLREAGYRFCRVAFRPLIRRVFESLFNKRIDRIENLMNIRGIQCLRLNTAGGFSLETRKALLKAAGKPGFLVVYGHPHSLSLGNSQDENWLVPFLRRVQKLKDQGRVRISLPRELVLNQA